MAAEFPGTPGTSESSVADAPLEDVQVSRCCQVWKNKYSKAERGRVFLKQGIRILEKGYDDIQAENLTLKKAYEEEQALMKVEKEGRERELALRVSLENELSVLKSEISNLKKKGVLDIEDKIEEIKHLKARVSDMNKEISWLKELVEKEKKRADLERRKADEASTYAATDRGKAGEELRLKQLETLRKDVSEAKSKLDSEKSKIDEETKKLQEEKEKAVEERKLVDLEMAKASELRKIAEETKKKAVDERKSADLEMAKAEKQRKIAKETKKKAVEERKRADLEMAEAVKQRKIAEENKKAVEGAKVEEQRKVVEASTYAATERGKAGEEHRLKQLETLKKDVSEAKSKLDSEKSKIDEETKKLQEEKEKAVEERKLVDLEMAKASELRKIAEETKKKAVDERKSADLEMAKAEKLRKIAKETKKKAVEEKKRADLEMAEAVKQRKIAEENMKKAVEVRKQADIEMAKAEEQRKIAEENKKAVEGAKVEEQRKVVEATKKKAVKEKLHNNNLTKQLEQAWRRNEELHKILHELSGSRNMEEALFDQPDRNTIDAKTEKTAQFKVLKEDADKSRAVSGSLQVEDIEKEKTISERKKADSNTRKAEKKRKLVEVNTKTMKREHRGDHPSKLLEDSKLKINELQKQIHELSSNEKRIGELFASSNNGISAEVAEAKLLKKQLKFEKERVKHAKDVARLEKCRSNLLQQELGCMKLKLIQLLDRLDAVDNCFLAPAEGIYDMEKAGDFSSMQRTKLKKKLRSLQLQQTCLQTENQFLKTRHMDTTASNPLGETFRHDDHLLPIRGGNCCESITGINAKLESLFGGSNKRMLQSSAINSSTASFSDRQLVGSQERGAHSVTTSAKLGEENLNLQPTISSMSGEVTKNRCSENPAVVAENSVKSPLGSLGRVKGRVRKRKMMLDTVECIETLCCESKKLHLQLEDKISLLHGMVQMDKLSEEAKSLRCNLQDVAYSVHDRSRKRRKASHEETLAMEQYCDGQQIKQMQGCSEHLCNPDTIDPKTIVGFEEIVYKNYMKLLDLDDAAEEECYRMAVERPVSPTLPEMEFPGIKSFEVDEFRLVQDENCERFSLENENPASSDKFDDMNLNSSIQLQCSRVDTSPKLQHENGCSFGSFDFLKRNEKGFCGTLLAERAFLSDSQNCGVDLKMSVAPSSGDGVVTSPSESEIRSTIESTPKYCVMFSDIKDDSSLSRIFRATKTCMVQCSLPARKEFVLHKISHALKLEEELLPREKACVFFSLVLLNFCTATSKNCSLLKDFIPCLDLFAEHINEVISDAEARSVVDELCLDELLSLIEEFLIEGRVLLCAALSSETSVECDSRRHAIFDGSAVVFTHEAASADLLVAGSIILGSVCAAADRAGFLCEAAYNIFRMHRYDTSVVLVILHGFAYVGGNKMFTLGNYSLTMTVLKSIVIYLESEHAPMATATHSFVGDVLPQFHACVGCPFSKDALSVDIVASLLFTKLQNFARSGFMHQNLMANSSNSSVMSIENIAEQNLSCFLDMNVSCCLDKCSLAGVRSGSVVTETLCDIGDILSLMELLACNMSWNWTCNKIIAQLWSTLESSALENLSVAIIILLGQLGRIGVDAVGYEDKEVENLRMKLNAFLLRETTIRAGLPIQLATVAALLGLTSLDLNNIELVSAMSGQFVPANLLKNWFLLLTEEQQAISIRLFQSVD